jgi:multicomponent Na+:H+ antiporter subunit F
MGPGGMNTFLSGLALALATITALSFYRVLAGPTAFDRLVGLGIIGTKIVVLLILIGAITHRTDMLVDLALTYALISFIGTLVLAKFFETQKPEEAT